MSDQSYDPSMETIGEETTSTDEDQGSNGCEEENVQIISTPSRGTNQEKLDSPFVNTIIESPNGTMRWIPNVEGTYKPITGMIFNSFEDAKKHYETYAEQSGFETRLSTVKKVKGVVTHRYIVCSKHGESRKRDINSLVDPHKGTLKRRSSYKVSNCKASVRFKAIPGTLSYKLYDFREPHNHPLVEDENKDFTKSRRRLQYPEQQFIHRVSQSNIGPCVAYRLKTLASGGRNMVRGTPTEWRNFRRDMNVFIGERDAHMIVDKMVNRREHVPNFSFEYRVVDNKLTGLFWADEIAKLNYNSFNDVIAFDATYHTNKYDMIFVPFTGVDHHNKCVIFGAGLLGSESKDSYKWLLQCFVDAHHKHPRLVLTDQDPAMKDAVSSVFTESRHRLCAWHVTNKIPWKIKGDSDNNSTLRTAIHKLVWNTTLSASEFEEKWEKVIEEFDVKNHKWLTDMYAIKERWIPGYFQDIPMSCLMKTTSRAESTNSYFKIYSNPNNTLVQFMLSYESAIEAQRYNQRTLDNETKTTTPAFITHLDVERYAATVYTRRVFTAVQKEMWKAVWRCYQRSIDTEDGVDVCIIRDKDKEKQINKDFKVRVDLNDNQLSCSCNLFMRVGYLCRHVLCVLKDKSVDKIPEQYIHRRWRMHALPDDIYKSQHAHWSPNDRSDVLMTEAISLVETCATRLRGDVDKMDAFVHKLKELMDDVFKDVPDEPDSNDKTEIFKSLLGVSPPNEILFTAPEGINNKGSRSKKRLIGKDEMIKQKRTKTRRLCRYCKLYDFHDIRTCEQRKEDEAAREKLEKEKRNEVGTSKVRKE